MKKLLAATIVGIAMLSAGCTTTGNKVLKEETQASVDAKLNPGMTKAEVQNLYGEPLDVTYTDSGNEVWKYAFVKSKLKARALCV